jgi:iron complex outermembrane receptor protein
MLNAPKAGWRSRCTCARRLLLLTCSTVGLFGISISANAQTTSNGATSEPSADQQVEQVLVTARRTAENIQSVPISISAFSQATLDENHIESLSDLQYEVPSMNVSAGNTGRDFPIVSIRGINGQATDGQGVVTYLNEVALPPGAQFETGGGIGLLYDLDSVQVLKGPQGTLFGRDALGGAVLYQTRRPTNDFSGYLDATAGNYGDKEFTGALNVPVIDDMLAFRVAANVEDRDGFTHSLGTENHPDGVDLDNRDIYALRGTVTFKPFSNVQNDFIFDYVHDYDNGTSAILVAVNPNSLGAEIFPGLLTDLAEQNALGPRTELPTNNLSYDKSTLTSYTDILKVEISDNVIFRNIASANRDWTTFAGDWDGTDLPIISTSVGGGGPTDTPYILQTYSEEAQFQGTSFDGKLKWTVGGIYEDRPEVPKYNFTLEVFGSLVPTGPTQSETNSEGLYAQGTYDLSELLKTLNFTAGIRESWDYVKDLNAPPNPSASFNAPTWTLGLDYHPVDDTMVYLTARRGYHTGGINNLGGSEAVGYQPEYIDDLEAGIKSQWDLGSAKGLTDFDVYRSEYTNFQNTQTVIVPGTNPPVLADTIGNSGAAQIWGAEFSGTLYPIENLQLTSNIGWMDFEYTKFGPGADVASLEQTVLANGAKYKYGLGARYFIPVDADVGDVSVGANWTWQSRTTYRFGPNLQPAYGLLAIQAEWNHIFQRPIGLSFFMTNALNELYTVNSYDFTQGSLGILGTRTDVYGPPRMFGFRLHYDFGGEK